MLVVIAADHAGYHLKNLLANYLSTIGYTVNDLGTFHDDPDDYPDYARSIARAVLDGKAERGILVCGSGVGAAVAANKFPGIRAGLCHDTFSAHQGVEDDNMNVLCLGARVVGTELAKEIARTFLGAVFSNAERHVRRIGKVAEIEKECMKIAKEGETRGTMDERRLSQKPVRPSS